MAGLLIRPPEPAVAQALEVLLGILPVAVTVPASPRKGSSSFALAQPLGREPQFPGGFRDAVGVRPFPHTPRIKGMKVLVDRNTKSFSNHTGIECQCVMKSSLRWQFADEDAEHEQRSHPNHHRAHRSAASCHALPSYAPSGFRALSRLFQ